MKSLSLVKLFTAVIIVVGGLSAWGSDYSSCLIKCKNPNKSDTLYACRKEEDTAKRKKCEEESISECNKICGEEKLVGGSEEEARKCKDATKEWREKAPKGLSACNAFDKKLGESCQEKIDKCNQKISSSLNGEDGDLDQSVSLIKQIVMTQLPSNSSQIAEDALNGEPACVKQFDAKTKKEDAKDFAREKKELERDIKKERDKQNEETEKLREKKDKITAKITELEEDAKKESLKRETKMREETTRLSKSTVDIGKKLRAYDTAILAEQQKLTKLRFAHQTAMLDLTNERIVTRCKQQLLTLKNGILNPNTVNAKERDQITSIANQLDTGAVGTANLNKLLKQTKEACFQQENTKKQQALIQYNEDQVNTNKRIEEIQSNIADEKKQLEIDKASLASVKSENEKEQAEAEKTKLKKIEDANNELTNFQDSVNEKIKTSREEAQKLNEEIQNLVLKKTYDVEPAFADASEAIEAAENARQEAYEACGCDQKESKVCTTLKKSDKNYKKSEDKSSGKSKQKSTK